MKIGEGDDRENKKSFVRHRIVFKMGSWYEK